MEYKPYSEKTHLKQYEELTKQELEELVQTFLTNPKMQKDIVFSLLMDNSLILEEFIRIFLNREVTSITNIQTQRTIKENEHLRGARFDIMFKGDDSIYEVEMQVTRQDLPLRTRFYQSIMDRNLILPGEDFSKLRKTIIIFVSMFDSVGLNELVYEREMTYKGHPNIKYDDRTEVYYINASCTNPTLISKDVTEYIDRLNGNWDSTTTNIGRLLDNQLYTVKYSGEERLNIMTYNELVETSKQYGVYETLYIFVKKHLIKGDSPEFIREEWITDYPYIDQVIKQVQQDLSQQDNQIKPLSF